LGIAQLLERRRRLMPSEITYERQVGPSTAAALPRATPAAFGAGIGDAVSDLGEKLQQINADNQATDFNARFAQAREQMDKL